jgi:hypothetical protein
MGVMRLLPCAAFSALAAFGLLSPRASLAHNVTELVPLRVKLGVLQPQGRTAETFGSQHYGVQVDIAGSKQADATTLSVGYFQARRNGQSMRTIPVLLTKTSEGSSPVSGLTGFYSGTGFGIYFIDAAGSGLKQRFGGYFSGGYRVSGGFYVEAQYHLISGNVNGFRPNGLAILLGRRF